MEKPRVFGCGGGSPSCDVVDMTTPAVAHEVAPRCV